MAESYLNRIIKTGDTPTPSGYVRLTGVPDGESIIANAPVIENGGVNYYPIYYMCLMDTVASESFTKTGTGVSTGADAYVFSDEPSTLYVGDTTHTFDVSQDSETSENWKCRYVIAYATEANKNDANGITVNLYSSKTPFEFIGSSYLKLSSTSALFGDVSGGAVNLRYINLSSSSFYNNEISVASFCAACFSLITLSLPTLTTISGMGFCTVCHTLTSVSLPVLTTISGGYFCQECYALTSVSLPALENVSGENFCYGCGSLTDISFTSLVTVSGNGFCSNCNSLKTVSLPVLTTINGYAFCEGSDNLHSVSLPALITVNAENFCMSFGLLKYFNISNTVTSITNTSENTLACTQFIGLPTDFNISGCHFEGFTTRYPKSLTWFTHLATQLKDNSSGTAKTMVIGAENIALIPTATATIISNKNWTLS